MGELPTDKIIQCFYGSSEDCVKVLNTDGMLMSFNPNGLKVMEIDDERDVIGKDWLQFWSGTMQPKAAAAIKKALGGELARFEGYCPTFKGTMKYWEVSVAPLYDDYQGIQWLLVMSRDATEQKELEKKFAEQSTELVALRQQLALVDSLPN